MKYCTKCVMPNTRPGITFDDKGICAACQSYENRKNVDYKKRWQELETLCNKYRGMNGPNAYDCMIAVSGGKDSHFQVYIMKEKMGMNPLLVSVEDNFPMTNAGVHNLKNISESFSCDLISMKPNIQAQKKIGKYTFEKYGKPTYFIDRYIYTYPLHMAVKFNTPLLVYGENVAYEYGGAGAIETYSSKDQISNGVGNGIPTKELLAIGIEEKNLNFFEPPHQEDIDKLDPIYLSYFLEWSSFDNYEIAKKYGFHDLTHEWTRTHHVEQFDQVDTPAYLVHSWMKYPKFGHASATDYSARMVRYGMLTRSEAIELVKKHDHALDPRSVREFCQFFGYSEKEFWKIIDNQYNPELFIKKNNGTWVLKNNNLELSENN
ncbi:N-acetyl sugar amidotransferase [Aliarcobacter butzleri]|uniref:N-acetyl sugar amidotransferase n=1 Tax=Aliarcobacter butzleri TaxID=28197 RepID=UPI0021B244CB|nr:N-acetyl sugar amidotransferase [Aliarcobacter butzleri]MCT7614603.1 N-acetyl sugar amidotransferase [Aliarcobacter butzleri]MCT7646444.1 N-acetyl sugar amidotransferase [Aliarcobacter butzleri]